jgi:thioesterase domain-containing protein
LDAFPVINNDQTEGTPEEYLEAIIGANPEMSEMIEDTHRTCVIEIIKNNVKLHRQYNPFTYSGDVLLFIATREHGDRDVGNLWRPYINGRVKTFPIACRHHDMLQREPIAQIAQVLTRELQKLPHLGMNGARPLR